MRRILLIALPALALLGLGAGGYWYFNHGDKVADARYRMSRGDLRGAELDLTSFLKRHPRDPEASYRLGIVNLAEDNPVAAERNLKIARDGKYDAKQIVIPLGEAYLRQRRFEDVLTDFDADKAAPGTKAQVLGVRASAYLSLNRIAEARQAASDAVAAAPDSTDAKLIAARIELAAGDEQTASQRVDQALKQDPKRAEALLLKGELAMHHGNTGDALKYAQDALAANPNRIDAKMAAARALAAQHKDLEATKLVDEVIKRTPRDVAANYLRVILAVRQRDFATAEAALGTISPVIDKLPQGEYFLAITKLGRNQPAQAQEAAAKYVAGAPNDPAGVKLLAFAELALHRADRALEALKPLTGAPNPDADTLDLLARAQAMTGDMKSAEANLTRASAMEPGNTEILNRLAAAKLGLGNTAAGQDELRQSLTKQPDQPAAAETLVQTALAAGDTKGAAATVAGLRKAMGDTELVGVLDAQVKVANLDLQGAKALYEDVLKRYPDSRSAIFGLLQAEGRLGDAKGAQDRLAGWMAMHPTDKQGLQLQLKALSGAGDIKGAIAAAEAAHAADPADVDITQVLAKLYLSNKAPDKAVALLDRASGPPNAVLLALRGQALVSAGRQDDARKSFLQAIDAAPNALGPRFGLLELALNTKDYAQARSVVDEALRIAPGNPQLLQAEVAIDLKENGIKAALETAEKLKQDPQNMPAAMLLPGSALAASGDLKGAADSYVAAFHEAPSSGLAAAAASALAQAGRQKEAQALLANWAPNNPKDVIALQVLASYALTDHRWDDAARMLDQILVLAPNSPVALNNAAWTRLHAGNLPGALAYAQRAYYLAPSPETEDTLGWVLAKSGQTGTALTLLEQAAAAKPKSDILYHYAYALNAEGHTKDARAALQHALADAKPFDERADAQALLAGLKP